jgi:phenylalanyl-tRNA synthetase beta chain
VNVQALLDGLNACPPAIVTAIELFDVYRGKGIDSGKKSLAFRVLMQDTRKTLTDEEVDGTVALLTSLLADRFGAKLRN